MVVPTDPDFVERMSVFKKDLQEVVNSFSNSTQSLSESFTAISKHISNSSTLLSDRSVQMSDSYPFKINSVSLNHKGGTKAYHLVLITNNKGKSIVIFRWGKVGSFGEISVNQFEHEISATKAFDKKLNDKIKNGYEPIHARYEDEMAVDFSELTKTIGRPLVAKLGASDLKHLDPDMNISGVRERDQPRLDENGRLDQKKIEDDKRRAQKHAEELMRETKLKEEEEARRIYAKNPNFGAF